MNARSNFQLSNLFLVLLILAGACSATSEPSAPESSGTTETTENTGTVTTAESQPTSAPQGEQLFPDVIAVEAKPEGENAWTFSVTLSSPYDSPERYADSWRVVGPDGTVYGERFLTHDHASEQPFTRSESGIEIPAHVLTVTVEGRDQINGWGGTTMDYTLSR